MKTIKELATESILIQDAVNLQAVVITFSNALIRLREIAREEGWNDTDKINRHPICIMYASKIASLTGCESGLEFSKAYNWCCDISGVH